MKVLEGACLAEDIIRVMAEDYDLPAPEFIDSTAGLAATDLEWDGQSEYVCEGCGEIESADNRVAYNVFKKSRAEGGN